MQARLPPVAMHIPARSPPMKKNRHTVKLHDGVVFSDKVIPSNGKNSPTAFYPVAYSNTEETCYSESQAHDSYLGDRFTSSTDRTPPFLDDNSVRSEPTPGTVWSRISSESSVSIEAFEKRQKEPLSLSLNALNRHSVLPDIASASEVHTEFTANKDKYSSQPALMKTNQIRHTTQSYVEEASSLSNRYQSLLVKSGKDNHNDACLGTGRDKSSFCRKSEESQEVKIITQKPSNVEEPDSGMNTGVMNKIDKSDEFSRKEEQYVQQINDLNADPFMTVSKKVINSK